MDEKLKEKWKTENSVDGGGGGGAGEAAAEVNMREERRREIEMKRVKRTHIEDFYLRFYISNSKFFEIVTNSWI